MHLPFSIYSSSLHAEGRTKDNELIIGIYTYEECNDTHYITETNGLRRVIPVLENSLRFVSNFQDDLQYFISEGDILFDVEHPDVISVVRFDRQNKTFFEEWFTINISSDETTNIFPSNKITPIINDSYCKSSIIIGNVLNVKDFDKKPRLSTLDIFNISKIIARYEKYDHSRRLL